MASLIEDFICSELYHSSKRYSKELSVPFFLPVLLSLLPSSLSTFSVILPLPFSLSSHPDFTYGLPLLLRFSPNFFPETYRAYLLLLLLSLPPPLCCSVFLDSSHILVFFIPSYSNSSKIALFLLFFYRNKRTDSIIIFAVVSIVIVCKYSLLFSSSLRVINFPLCRYNEIFIQLLWIFCLPHIFCALCVCVYCV